MTKYLLQKKKLTGKGSPDQCPKYLLQTTYDRILRLLSRYADVVRDLDRPARKVWDELYALFQAAFRDAWERGSSPGALASGSRDALEKSPGTQEYQRIPGYIPDVDLSIYCYGADTMWCPAVLQEKMRVDLTDEDRMSSIRRQTKG